jgi:hypothetical protein
MYPEFPLVDEPPPPPPHPAIRNIPAKIKSDFLYIIPPSSTKICASAHSKQVLLAKTIKIRIPDMKRKTRAKKLSS